MTLSAELFARGLHVKCRNTKKPYLRSEIFRFPVEDGQVRWDVKFENYSPPDYTAKFVEGKPWADPFDVGKCKFNTPNDEEGIIRTSFHGEYSLDQEGRPLNPFGRTGIRGRGAFGKWGPNHAADAIVSRQTLDGRLQFVAIERHDTGELAIPGGMLDKGEIAADAVVREFIEEVLGGKSNAKLALLWQKGVEIYKGYMDDPRNTDNAWGETTCINFHDSSGLFNDIKLEAGDDAKTAHWTDVSKNLKLYASHEYLIYLFAKLHGVELF